MVDATHISYPANDRSYFALLKKDIKAQALGAGLSIAKANDIDIIVSEMTTNLFKYSNYGEILVSVSGDGSLVPYIEIISIDRGPGMANPARMMEDGFSTSNTLGHGLGSIQRLSDDFDLYSMVGWGTIVLSRVFNEPEDGKAGRMLIRPIVISKPGETTSGDGFMIKQNKTHIKFILCDGLGHGPEANHAVNAAAESFWNCPFDSPTEILRFIHPTIKKTRGLVATAGVYDIEQKNWLLSGIGNIGSRLIGPNESRAHMSYNGIVGHNIPTTMSDQLHSSEKYNYLVMCSDGIRSRWDYTKYPMILKHDPAILSAAIYLEHARKTDDMSVVTIRVN